MPRTKGVETGEAPPRENRGMPMRAFLIAVVAVAARSRGEIMTKQRFFTRILTSFTALTLSATVVSGADIEVADGLVEVVVDGQCSLIEALENANDGGVNSDCTAGSDGADTIHLAPGSVYTLTDSVSSTGGPTGLPRFSSEVSVLGYGATIERAAGDGVPRFRLLRVDNADVTLDDVVLKNGSASGSAGGILMDGGNLAISGSTLTGNSAGSGGAIASLAGTLTIRDTTLSGNSASTQGGALSIAEGTATITNATFSNNSAADEGGAIQNFDGATLVLRHVTLAGNSAGVSGAIASTGQLTLENTLIADSTGGECASQATTLDGVNLIEDGSCGCQPPGCVSGDPALGPLAPGGGQTETHALLEHSIAIDKADDEFCEPLDQRGAERPVDGDGDGSAEDLNGGCDLGAYEVQDGVAPPPTVNLKTPPDGARYSLILTLFHPVRVAYSCDGADVSCSGTQPNGSILDTSRLGTRSFTVTAVDEAGNTTTVTHHYTVALF